MVEGMVRRKLVFSVSANPVQDALAYVYIRLSH